MDIGKYIGQFLLKNSYCYIHGLGNLELVKKPAVHDGKTLLPPSYEVIATSGGSIDDSFANFIATNEQISISKAANALRDYSIESRSELQAGREVVIDGIGKFIDERGKVKFITDAAFRFSPAGMPALKNSKQVDEQKAAPPHKPTYPAAPPEPAKKSGSVNWSTIIIVAILLLLIAGAGIGLYQYNKMQAGNPAPPPVVDTVVATPPPTMPDSSAMPPDSSATTSAMPEIDSNAVNSYKMVIGSYDRAKAEKRFRQLKISGNPGIEIVTKDSVTFKVLIPVNCRAMDTTHYIDSFKAWFGYHDVVIYNN